MSNDSDSFIISSIRVGMKREFSQAFDSFKSYGSTRSRTRSQTRRQMSTKCKMSTNAFASKKSKTIDQEFVNEDIESVEGGWESYVADSNQSIMVKRFPENLKELLETGLLEGLSVWYCDSRVNKKLHRGLILGCGILCYCETCDGKKVINPNQFQLHAVSVHKQPSDDYILLENGNTLKDVLDSCRTAQFEKLEDTILKRTFCPDKKRPTFCLNCKGSIHVSGKGKCMILCDLCMNLIVSETKLPYDRYVNDHGQNLDFLYRQVRIQEYRYEDIENAVREAIPLTRETSDTMLNDRYRSKYHVAQEVPLADVMRRLLDLYTRRYEKGYKFPGNKPSLQVFDDEVGHFCLLKDKSQITHIQGNGDRFERLTSVIEVLMWSIEFRTRLSIRDVFYRVCNNTPPALAHLYKNQKTTDSVISDICLMLECTRHSLNLMAWEKGSVLGNLQFSWNDKYVDCSDRPERISTEYRAIKEFTTDASFVLLVEKHTALNSLMSENFHNNYKCLIITGNGFPDFATREFLKNLKSVTKLPVFAVVDCDPPGYGIFSVFKHGGKTNAMQNFNLTTQVILIGVTPSDMELYMLDVSKKEFSKRDKAVCKKLLAQKFVVENSVLDRELRKMFESKKKADIGAVNTQSLSSFIALKLFNRDWIL